MLHLYHTHAMPDAGTDTHSDKVLARIYGTLNEVNAYGQIGEGGKHWTSDSHSVAGVAHGHGSDDGRGTTAKSERSAVRLASAPATPQKRMADLLAEVAALTAVIAASKALADAELAASFDAAEADELRAQDAADNAAHHAVMTVRNAALAVKGK